jgi:hypothetical protein
VRCKNTQKVTLKHLRNAVPQEVNYTWLNLDKIPSRSTDNPRISQKPRLSGSAKYLLTTKEYVFTN